MSLPLRSVRTSVVMAYVTADLEQRGDMGVDRQLHIEKVRDIIVYQQHSDEMLRRLYATMRRFHSIDQPLLVSLAGIVVDKDILRWVERFRE